MYLKNLNTMAIHNERFEQGKESYKITETERFDMLDEAFLKDSPGVVSVCSIYLHNYSETPLNRTYERFSWTGSFKPIHFKFNFLDEDDVCQVRYLEPIGALSVEDPNGSQSRT